MISEKIGAGLNEQIHAEIYSSYLYLSMEVYFASQNFSGFTNWMRAQVQEELSHVAKTIQFLKDRNGRVLLKAVESPPTEWQSPLAAFEASLVHEQLVSGRINSLVELAMEDRDHATVSFLQWFVTEQVEEEATVSGIIQQLRMVADAPAGVFLLDRELGSRTFTAEA
ncbi:MAG: ferritin [Deltaproteobacteria bacterium]|nr:ferritin [Deltaproteobacteria bacterium]